jgi:hypothetical protein
MNPSSQTVAFDIFVYADYAMVTMSEEIVEEE